MQRVGFYLRVKFFVQAWFFKLAFASFFKITRILNASKLGQILPSYTKRYPIRPMLEHRIFVPAGAETPGAKLPLLISIHGGVSGAITSTPRMQRTHFTDKQRDTRVSFSETHKVMTTSTTTSQRSMVSLW